ncbi:MAG: TonB-dependent receptor [Chthoniobacterales bacterium]|nr:TonB-dependent receptor [Chthoniobacterales bacterium]
MKTFTALSLALVVSTGFASAQDAVAPSVSPTPAGVAEHDRVIVSTTPLGGDLFDQTQSVTVLTGEELKLRLEPTLGETLSREPGVSSTYFGPGASRPVIRGLGDDRIRVLQNGVTTIDVSNVSPDHAVSTEPLTIKAIDVVRGPASLLYGPNTVGGVVNVIDNRIPTEKLQRPIEGKAEGRFGTADEERSGAGVFEFGLGPIVVHLDGFKRETDDVEIPGFARSERLRRLDPLPPGEVEARGTLPNSFTESEGGAVGASYVWDKGYIGAAFSGIDSRYGTVAEEEVTIELEQRRWDVRGAFNQPFTPIKAVNYKFSYSDYTHTEFEGPEVGTVFAIDGYDARLEVLHEKLGPLEGALGYQGQLTNFSALGAEAFLPAVETRSNAVFIFEEVALEPVRLQFGARYDRQSNETDANPAFGPGLSRDFDAFSGSAGIVYTPVEPYVIAFSVAYTQRPPTYVELFANGPHIATNAFEIGDPDLGKEDSVAFDLSFRKKSGRITGSLSFFYNRFSDFIIAKPTGEFSEAEEEEEGLPIFAYESVDADFLGGELALTFHILEPYDREEAASASGKESKAVAPTGRIRSRHELHLDAKADYVYAQDREADRSLPRIPPFRTSAALVYGWGDRFGARIEGQYVAEQDRTAAFELPTDDYFLLGASVSYRIKAGPIDFDVYLKGTNLTDEEARVHTSFLKDIAPLAGRGALLGVRATF